MGDCSAQPVTSAVAEKNLPAGIRFQGNFIDGRQWSDTQGKHIVIRTETAIREHGSTRSAGLNAWHYLVKKDSSNILWKIKDFVNECEVDVTASFIKNVFAITDLDKNEVAEVWLLYITSCKGDVSPDNLKLIMYEGNKKYAMRGRTKMKINDTDVEGGEYTFDGAFKSGITAFRTYAKKLWLEYVSQ